MRKGLELRNLSLFRLYETTLDRIVLGLNYLNIAVIIPVLVAVVIGDIAARSLLETAITWAHEVSGLLLMCLFFLALPACIQKKQLLDVDLVFQIVPHWAQYFLARFSSLLICFFALLLMYAGYLGAKDSYEYQDQAYTIDLPYWPFYGLICFVGCVVLLQGVLLLFERTEPEPPHTTSQEGI